MDKLLLQLTPFLATREWGPLEERAEICLSCSYFIFVQRFGCGKMSRAPEPNGNKETPIATLA